MSPITSIRVADLCDKADDEYVQQYGKDLSEESPASPTKTQEPVIIIWRNVFMFALLHLAALYGLYLSFTAAKWQTNLFGFALYALSGMGVTAGAHRLWAHRTYKAKLPLRIFLAFLFTIAYEHDIYDWCRDHRVHHKYTETDADPHNAKRGFFFSHIGWLMCRKHPDVIRKGKTSDLSDLMADPVVRIQRKYYYPLAVVCCFVIPTMVSMYMWNETFLNALFIPGVFRLCFTLNQTWMVNSAAHLWGRKPYDVNISPSENWYVVIFAGGEGYHNYHHTFPYDYSTSEYGFKYNMTTAFIDFMALLGLAYDRKTVNRDSIKLRKLRTGEDSLKKINQPELQAPKEE